MTKNLPVLDAVTKAVKKAGVVNLQNVLFVCVQHLLHTSVNLFESLIELGANPANIFLIGKHYSECPAVVQKILDLRIQLQKLTPLTEIGEYTTVFNKDVSVMWENAKNHIDNNPIDMVVVLDDGGKCLEFISRGILKELPVIGIEQTTAGLFNPTVLALHVPFIDVAMCAAKAHLESEIIAEAIFNKLRHLLPSDDKSLVCGVVGVGVIGKAVAKKLISLGYSVLIFDQKNQTDFILGSTWVDGIENLIFQSDLIFGCTGRDFIEGLDILALINKDKFFISCTSEDKEFLSLLKFIRSSDYSRITNPLNDLNWTNPINGSNVRVYKGGFPVNFDDSGESASAKNIQLTRGLLLSAIIQSVITLPDLMRQDVSGRVMLYPKIQQFVVKEWIGATNKYLDPSITRFNDSHWIAKNSQGKHFNSQYLTDCFLVETETNPTMQGMPI